MRLRYIRTSSIYCSKSLIPSQLAHLGRNAVCCEDHSSAFNLTKNLHPIRSIERDDSFIFKGVSNMTVMNNHPQNIYWPRQVQILGSLSGKHHCIDDPIAITARRNFNNFH
ncbi:hypothetical protein D3C76_1202920 [compost metagenome]